MKQGTETKFGIALKNIGTGMAFNGDGDDVTLMGESYESTLRLDQKTLSFLLYYILVVRTIFILTILIL